MRTRTHPFQLWFVIHRLGLAIANLTNKLEVSTSSDYNDTQKAMQNAENAVVWGR